MNDDKAYPLAPFLYAVKDSEDYSINSVDSTMPTISTLKIGQKAGSNIYKSTKNDCTAYGITGDTVTFYLKLKDSSAYSTNGWQIENDTFGKKEKQLIEGAQTGQIDTGALVIQKSTNGANWENVDLGKYANGLYTTDFTNNYADLGDVFIYSPDGQDVLSGVYIRILYAYKTKEVSGKTKKRCVEEYKFYLCSNELDAVTFQNLSVTEETNEVCGEDDEIVAEMYKKSQTLTSGAVTVSGFEINTSLNPTVTYTVKRDGATVSIPSNHQFTETGKYEIELKSAVGATKSVTIYVDRMTASEALDYYFGEGFIQGKRIYSEGEYPVYEGGCTKYNISSVDTNHLPVYGYIQNVTTGEKIEIASTRTAKSTNIMDAGEYVAVLCNNPTYETEVISGDNRVINGKEYTVQYNRGIAAQLSAQDCPTGILTITESTVYGDSTSYNAIYFADGDNTAQLTLEYYSKGNKDKITYSQDTVENILTVDLFSLASLKDALDSYDVVIIDGPSGVFAYAEDNLENAVWADPGEYTITVVNRIGNKYEVKIVVDESEYATISFSGDGTENLETIIASFGDKNIELPIIEKEGYTFIGFEDNDANLYPKMIDKVDFKGSIVLSPVWKANQCTLTLKNTDGTEISATGVSFGAEYDLLKLEDRDGEVFAGWIDDNGEIYTGTIKITSDKDIVLTALYQNAEMSEGKIENSSQNQNGFGFVIIIVVILLAGACGTYWFIRNKDKNKTMEQKEEEDEKNNKE